MTGPADPLAAGRARRRSTTAHAAPDVEVFLSGVPLPAAASTFVSPTQVDITIPAGTAAGPAELVLRAGTVAGPVVRG